MDDIKVTLGFWVGMVTGVFIGLFIFGITIIGQSIWTDGMETGKLICQAEQQLRN
jgi:hypothetical protein